MSIRSIALLFLFVSTAIAVPEVKPKIESSIDLDDLITAAIESNPSIELGQTLLESGQISERSLSWWNAPEVRLGYGRDVSVFDRNRSTSYPNHDYDTSLRIFPKSPWEHEAQRLKLGASNRLQELSNKETKLGIAQGITELYWETCYVHAEYQLRSELYGIYQKQVAAMDQLLQGRHITVGESLPAKMKLLDTGIEVEAQKREFKDLLSKLATFCNLDMNAIEMQQIPVIDDRSFDLPYSSWLSSAISLRTDITRNELLIEDAQADLAKIKASRKLWIKHIEAGYGAENNFGTQDSASIEVAFELPFLVSDGGQKQIATNMVQTYRRQEEFSRKIIEQEVSALISEFKSLEQQWQMQGVQVRSMQTELTQAINKMKTQGNQANRNYWDALTTLIELQLKELELNYNYKLIRVKASRILGKDPT